MEVFLEKPCFIAHVGLKEGTIDLPEEQIHQLHSSVRDYAELFPEQHAAFQEKLRRVKLGESAQSAAPGAVYTQAQLDAAISAATAAAAAGVNEMVNEAVAAATANLSPPASDDANLDEPLSTATSATKRASRGKRAVV